MRFHLCPTLALAGRKDRSKSPHRPTLPTISSTSTTLVLQGRRLLAARALLRSSKESNRFEVCSLRIRATTARKRARRLARVKSASTCSFRSMYGIISSSLLKLGSSHISALPYAPRSHPFQQSGIGLLACSCASIANMHYQDESSVRRVCRLLHYRLVSFPMLHALCPTLLVLRSRVARCKEDPLLQYEEPPLGVDGDGLNRDQNRLHLEKSHLDLRVLSPAASIQVQSL